MTRKSLKQTILIIEDDLDIQNFISRVLELEGYHVLRASDGHAGLDLLGENSVSIVLLDLRLPGPEGWSILQEIRSSPEHKKVPIVVLTAIAEANQRRRTMKMGATKYLVKPLSAHVISKTVTDILHEKNASLVTSKAGATDP